MLEFSFMLLRLWFHLFQQVGFFKGFHLQSEFYFGEMWDFITVYVACLHMALFQ